MQADTRQGSQPGLIRRAESGGWGGGGEGWADIAEGGRRERDVLEHPLAVCAVLRKLPPPGSVQPCFIRRYCDLFPAFAVFIIFVLLLYSLHVWASQVLSVSLFAGCRALLPLVVISGVAPLLCCALSNQKVQKCHSIS